MRIMALQLTSHSAFQSTGGRVWHRNLAASSEPRRRCGSQLSAHPLDGSGFLFARRGMSKLKREVLYFTALFVAPCLALIVLGATLTQSPLPLGTRLCTLEDTCAYGYCFFLPGFLYVGSRVLVFVLSSRRSRPH